MEPFRVYLPHGKPKIERTPREIFRRLCGAKNHKERKALLQTAYLPGEIPSWRGKPSPSSPPSSWTSSGSSSSSPPPGTSSSPSLYHLAVTSWVGSCVFHRGNSPGINYYLY